MDFAGSGLEIDPGERVDKSEPLANSFGHEQRRSPAISCLSGDVMIPRII
jgi:hypothetical protein